MKHDGLSYLAGPRLSNWCEFRALNGNLKIEADIGNNPQRLDAACITCSLKILLDPNPFPLHFL